MCLPRPIQQYHFQPVLNWWHSPFKSQSTLAAVGSYLRIGGKVKHWVGLIRCVTAHAEEGDRWTNTHSIFTQLSAKNTQQHACGQTATCMWIHMWTWIHGHVQVDTWSRCTWIHSHRHLMKQPLALGYMPRDLKLSITLRSFCSAMLLTQLS
jgi:hypothetical protein